MPLPNETQIKSMEHKNKIYIIGAGVSGLIAAYELEQAGYHPVIILAVVGIPSIHSHPLPNHTDRRCWFAAEEVAERTNNM